MPSTETRATTARRLRWWPRSLFGRLVLILCGGLALAHALSLAWIGHERRTATQAMMVAYAARDVSAAATLLDRVPRAERAGWLPVLQRPHYRYVLADTPPAGYGLPANDALAQSIGLALREALGPMRVAPLERAAGGGMLATVQLGDGQRFFVEIQAPAGAFSWSTAWVLLAQLAVLAAVAWLAVRQATRPLAELARAADALDPALETPPSQGTPPIAAALAPPSPPLPEDGPTEVARAAAAFNAMQRRIAAHLAERTRILAAIAHDLQTPITRMRLRTDLLAEGAASPGLREKLQADLTEMQRLVAEGIAYARSAHGLQEPPCAVDLHALLDTLVCDAVDAGHDVRLSGRLATPLQTQPHALRRVVGNLLDNAIKFAGAAEMSIEAEAEAGRVDIVVRDRGPGIPPDELPAVGQPFYRVESSRNRATGGTGLGLAIAQQLARALRGSLVLSNREGGGLEARLSLPLGAAPQASAP